MYTVGLFPPKVDTASENACGICHEPCGNFMKLIVGKLEILPTLIQRIFGATTYNYHVKCPNSSEGFGPKCVLGPRTASYHSVCRDPPCSFGANSRCSTHCAQRKIRQNLIRVYMSTRLTNPVLLIHPFVIGTLSPSLLIGPEHIVILREQPRDLGTLYSSPRILIDPSYTSGW